MLSLSGSVSQRKVTVWEGTVYYVGMSSVGSKKTRVSGEPIGMVVICGLHVLCGMFEAQVSSWK